MECLKCQGLMMVERHYTTMTRHLYARCLNCGFWFDLVDVLRFFLSSRAKRLSRSKNPGNAVSVHTASSGLRRRASGLASRTPSSRMFNVRKRHS